MPLRPIPARPRRHALVIAGVMLGAVIAARAADIPPGDAPPLGKEQLEALQEKRTAWAWNHGYGIPPIPLRLISNKVEFEAGKLSVVPDPSDSDDGRIAVYLVNATDEEVKGVDPNSPYCFLEVKDGNRWRACERFLPGCGTGFPFSKPAGLKGRNAAIFFGTDPSRGDLGGELRLCTTFEGVRPIVSASFQGHFSSDRYKEAAPPPLPTTESITVGLANMVSGKADDESPKGIARSPEEYIAAGELERCYDESNATKAALIRWQAQLASGECNAALAALLLRPWDHQLDAPALFDRCFIALTQRDAKQMDFGSPERCRAMVWRYLTEFRSEWQELQINPERWDQLERIRKSGNPWGVDDKSAIALIEEAIESLGSPNSGERDAAGEFLNGYWINEHHLSNDRYWPLLNLNIANVRKATIAVLARRGKSREVGKWLLNHPELKEPELAVLWQAAIDSAKSSPDWELPLALRLLEAPSIETLGALARRYALIEDTGGGPFPAKLRERFRQILSKEAEAKRWVGLPPPASGESDQSESRLRDLRSREPDRLRSALQVLASWGDPADTPLLKSYLAHPAAFYSTTDNQIIRHYQIRSLAADLLKERKAEAPEGIIFEERLQSK